MRNKFLILFVLLCAAQAVLAQEVKRDPAVVAGMASVFDSYRQLQPYIYGDFGLSDPERRKEAAALLARLGQGFHTADAGSVKFSNDPAFKATVDEANEEIQEAKKLLDSGQSGLAQIRLKNAANYCVSCHTSHSVDITFYDETADLSGMTPYQRGEYFLATRQFKRAREQFIESVVSGKENFRRQLALRGWLLITTRVAANPEAAIKDITELGRAISPTPPERELLAKWKSSFVRWAQEKNPNSTDLDKAEDLIARHSASLSVDPTGNQYEVEALRGTAMLHRILDQKSGRSTKARPKILYLLGLAYSGLKSFNMPELPRVFLAECIEGFPGTAEAKKSYELYSLVVTPKPGVQLPDEEKLRLEELRKRAYGEADFKDRI